MVQLEQYDRSVVNSVNTHTTNQVPQTNTWSGAYVQLQKFNNINLKDYIMLDNDLTTSMFAKKALVQDFYDVETPLKLMTNGREINLQQKAIVNGFGDVWFHPNSIAKIFSF